MHECNAHIGFLFISSLTSWDVTLATDLNKTCDMPNNAATNVPQDSVTLTCWTTSTTRSGKATTGKRAISPGWHRALVPVAQPGLTNRDWSLIFSPGCHMNRD
jgi:hypothetical protein